MYFSVIVPIYRVEEYLNKCIDSILMQSFKDFELILVDDGSDDKCPSICDEYAKMDRRIKVIHKENGGLVSARQAGVKIAQGDYVIAVDGDDWINSDYLQCAFEIFHKYNVDIISFAINYVYENKTVYCPDFADAGLYTENDLREKIIPKILLTPDMKHMHYYICCKAFKRELVYKFQMQVDKRISNGEDVACVVPAYLAAKSVYISGMAVYNCRCRQQSMSRSFNAGHFKVAEILLGYLSRTGDEEFLKAVDRFGAFSAFVLVAVAAETSAKNAVLQIKENWSPVFDKALKKARFKNITLKSKITLMFFKHKMIGIAYCFLKVCALIKGE